ncbi:MAG: ABC transporter ATP-binding protein [Bacteroidetes bacterium]|nr:ABC transporter ATP-binding protein [Bacteroidota bacterium]HET6244616.1 ABC transporter ATP-binding protein [Bacteroidia bacterium]
MTTNSAIQVSHLVKIYKGVHTPAVDDISFTIEKGLIWGLLGPNGAGKTTTLSILCGLLKQSEGEVLINGLHYGNHKNQIKHMISIVPQEIALYPTLTAFENLRYIGNMYGLKGNALKHRISECLNIFGLEQSINKQVGTFSGGMKRRINLIAGILNQPQILFLDEPTVGIDVQSRNIITEYLLNMNKQGTTIVYTSHLMEEAENLCSHIAIIDQGKIISTGNPKDLIQQNKSKNLEDLFLKLTGRKLRD